MVFYFSSYKAYIRRYISRQPKNGRGIRSELAKAMGAQTAFVSQVLNADAQLSMEQAQAVNDYLGHSPDQSKYFLLLVQKARAGTPSLRRFLEEQIAELKEQNLELSQHIAIKEKLTIEDQQRYYSAWYYGAIHVALSIPKLQKISALVEYFGLSQKIVENALEFLIGCRLAIKRGDTFKIGQAKIYLDEKSHMLSKHHTNWRIKAIQNLESSSPETRGSVKSRDMTFSSVVTLSKEDMIKIKNDLIKQIENTMEVVIDSKEEVVCAFNLDFFEVKK